MPIKALFPQRSQAAKEKSNDPVCAEDIRDEIQSLAYKVWLERGSPLGSPDADWYEAEARLAGKGNHGA